MSEWGEERMLPEGLLATREPDAPLRAQPQETGDATAKHEAPPPVLNAYAAEFLPTLSMSCPLVGICEVIVEGDEAKLSGEDAPSSELYFLPTHVVAPLHELNGPKASSSKKFWNKPRPVPLVVQPRVPQHVHNEEVSEEQLQRRLRSIEVGRETKEYQFHTEQIRLQIPGAEPLTPDPRDSSLSKRQWERVVQDWREELRRRYLRETEGISLENRPEAASVASTEAEEEKGSEADDSTTVNSDDASSSHWSSR